MFITKGHFLSPFVRVLKDNKVLGMLYSVDTDLMVAIRIVGFDEKDETPLLDLVKVDDIQFITDGMPSHVQDLLPPNFKIYSSEEE